MTYLHDFSYGVEARNPNHGTLPGHGEPLNYLVGDLSAEVTHSGMVSSWSAAYPGIHSYIPLSHINKGVKCLPSDKIEIQL